MPGVTDPAEEYFKDGQWGYDGSSWKKLGLLFGYNDTVSVVESTTNAAAGTNILDTDAFPADYVYVVQSIIGINLNTNPTEIRLLVVSGGNFVPLIQTANPGVDTPVLWSGSIVLKAGDYVRGRFKGCAAGDDLYLYVLGYKMKVA